MRAVAGMPPDEEVGGHQNDETTEDKKERVVNCFRDGQSLTSRSRKLVRSRGSRGMMWFLGSAVGRMVVALK